MFDKLDIAVINLDRRPDRMAYIHKSIPFLYNPMMRHHFPSSSMTRPMRMNTGIFASRGGTADFLRLTAKTLRNIIPNSIGCWIRCVIRRVFSAKSDVH